MLKVRGVVSEVLGPRRSWATDRAYARWAYMRLIHGPTVTPQFPCLEDYGNFHVLRRMDQTLKTSCLVHGDLSVILFFFFLSFFFDRYIWAGKFFNFPPKRFRDASLAQGSVGHLMHQIKWSKFSHVSKSEWSKVRPS
jgi:hypothetical protein